MINLPSPISTEGPPIDVPLLRKAVEWAEAESKRPKAESEWYQDAWIIAGSDVGRTCGTACCIAGHTVLAAGYKPFPDRPSMVLDAEGNDIFVDDTAQALLGLTTPEANFLFSGGNTIEDVRSAAERIAARAGERL